MPATTHDAPSRKSFWFSLAVLLVVLGAHAALLSVRWEVSGLIGQEFRQTQTAISCLFTQTDGYKLDYPTPVLGKPWSAPMEFPLYQWAVAAWAHHTGQPIHLAGRWVSTLSFYAALPALFLLLRRLRLPAAQAFLVLAFVLASPIYIFYTRAVLIESMALALVAWHLVFVVRCIAGPGRLWTALTGAWFFGAGAVLIKITTWLGWMLPAILLTVVLLWRAVRSPAPDWRTATAIALRALAATVPMLALGVWWAHRADAIKALNPGASFLLSSNLTQWNFGTLPMRLSADFWASVWRNVTSYHLATALLLACLPLALLQKNIWPRLAFLLVPFFGTLMTFTNLYYLHDYYYYALAIFAVIAAGCVLVGLFDLPQVPRWAAWSATLFALGLQFTTYFNGYFQMQRVDFYGGNGLTQALKSLSRPEDVIVIYGDDWASMIPYYSERRALMIPGWREHDETSIAKSMALLKDEKVTFLLMRGNSRTLLESVEARSRDLNLSNQLIFSHEPTGVDVYVHNHDVRRVAGQIATGSFHGIKLHYQLAGAKKPDPNQLTGVDDSVRRAYFYMMRPAPKLYRIPYELTVYHTDTPHPQFSAHSPTELIFDLPAGAKTVKAIVGIIDGAYQQGSTKGVAFELYARKPDTPDLLLHRLFLEPRFTPSDRGPHTLEVTLPAGYEGRELVFRSGPGPSGDSSFGWGYIEKLSID